MAKFDFKIPCKLAKQAEIISAILLVRPKSSDFVGTDQEWIEQFVLTPFVLNLYREGKKVAAANSVIVDDNDVG